ncbi:MAG: hypothetical protein C0432_01565 [Candidatus Puniceispirillum sp.]|nr:hypothetical protein [Candidatus Pelagibacter sp.]MBA4282967.1 hypothetical protein [Candidatus Puniceispirillum sp.]
MKTLNFLFLILSISFTASNSSENYPFNRIDTSNYLHDDNISISKDNKGFQHFNRQFLSQDNPLGCHEIMDSPSYKKFKNAWDEEYRNRGNQVVITENEFAFFYILFNVYDEAHMSKIIKIIHNQGYRSDTHFYYLTKVLGDFLTKALYGQNSEIKERKIKENHPHEFPEAVEIFIGVFKMKFRENRQYYLDMLKSIEKGDKQS